MGDFGNISHLRTDRFVTRSSCHVDMINIMTDIDIDLARQIDDGTNDGYAFNHIYLDDSLTGYPLYQNKKQGPEDLFSVLLGGGLLSPSSGGAIGRCTRSMRNSLTHFDMITLTFGEREGAWDLTQGLIRLRRSGVLVGLTRLKKATCVNLDSKSNGVREPLRLAPGLGSRVPPMNRSRHFVSTRSIDMISTGLIEMLWRRSLEVLGHLVRTCLPLPPKWHDRMFKHDSDNISHSTSIMTDINTDINDVDNRMRLVCRHRRQNQNQDDDNMEETKRTLPTSRFSVLISWCRYATRWYEPCPPTPVV